MSSNQAHQAPGTRTTRDRERRTKHLRATRKSKPLYFRRSPLPLDRIQPLSDERLLRALMLKLAEKDQRLAQEAAADLGAKVPINEAVRRMFAEAAETGRADQDVAAVAELCLEWSRKKK